MAFADPPRRARDELVVQSDLMAEVQAQLGPEIKRLEQLLRSMMPQQWPTPQVTVENPITVQNAAPELPGPADINLSLPGMDELRVEVAGLRADLVKLTSVLMAPVTKTPKRDRDGFIFEIIERRGQ